MSELRTNRIVPRDGLPSGSSGGIVQIKYAIKNGTQSIASVGYSDTPTDVSGLSVSITPTRSDSKILVMCSVNVSTDNANFTYLQLVRNSTHIYRGDAMGVRPRRSAMYYNGASDANEGMNATRSWNHMDEPATTSAVTYKIQIQCATAGNAHVNISHRNTNNADYDPQLASNITVMEVSG